jgi:hypothetical protein
MNISKSKVLQIKDQWYFDFDTQANSGVSGGMEPPGISEHLSSNVSEFIQPSAKKTGSISPEKSNLV